MARGQRQSAADPPGSSCCSEYGGLVARWLQAGFRLNGSDSAGVEREYWRENLKLRRKRGGGDGAGMVARWEEPCLGTQYSLNPREQYSTGLECDQWQRTVAVSGAYRSA